MYACGELHGKGCENIYSCFQLMSCAYDVVLVAICCVYFVTVFHLMYLFSMFHAQTFTQRESVFAMSDSDSNGTTSTEKSCVPARPKGRGKGRRQTGHMPKSSAKAKAAKSSKSLKAQMSQMKKQSCQSLKPSFVPEDQCDSTETSESEETKRIQMAEKAWNTKKSGNKIKERSDDDDIQNLVFDCSNQGHPKTVFLGDVVAWFLENVVKQDEMQCVTDASEGFSCKIGVLRWYGYRFILLRDH